MTMQKKEAEATLIGTQTLCRKGIINSSVVVVNAAVFLHSDEKLRTGGLRKISPDALLLDLKRRQLWRPLIVLSRAYRRSLC